ncbi:FAD/NAD(P)-binding protein [Streptomyces sp. LX-29]|uniref:FAD/NAD(P)-binding protein n=1 Tax=Streptomyces sp. LX-29 TaxID=2900152 RepID=UPI00240D8C72|nr:FAD/NAD(P)-binding protein [Streptomyces sp. LX-29]WFB09791.1 FAD/NAD(P)-binding protein [Streptomyces sp. LX-29]
MAGARPAPGVQHEIAIVGCGPRGTSVLERICASAPALAPGVRLTVHLIDPAPPGPGQVWRTAQPAGLLMNTVASQVTLFTDASVECAGPIRPGPSLYEWCAARGSALGPDDYPPRALYGRYLEWVFAEVARTAPEGLTVVTHATRAVRLEERSDGAQALTLDDGRRLTGLSAVVLAQGHLPTAPDAEQRRLAGYAAAHGLRHLPPGNPADLDLSVVAPGETVLLRGLGLNFFDHMALLTTGRGGRFATGADGALVYHASGREPRLYAGSRRGIPYHARGDNAKGACGRHRPVLLTPEVIALFRKRATAGDAPDFRAEIWPLVAKEVETVYYEALLAARAPAASATGPAGAPGTPGAGFRGRFLATPPGGPEEAAVLDAYGIGAGDRWSWEELARPYGRRRFAGPAEFRDWLVDHLRRDVAQARLGNVAGPVKAALDVLRDLRNELRQIVDHGGLPGPSRRADLDRWYTPLNAFLSIGPPRRRIEELVALIEAGVVEVLGPELEVGTSGPDERPGFLARSARVPGAPIRATTLIEARLPEPDLRRTADELLAHLLRTGGCRAHRVPGRAPDLDTAPDLDGVPNLRDDPPGGAPSRPAPSDRDPNLRDAPDGAEGYETGGLDVTPSPYHLIDAAGRPHPRRFALGVPTEGVHWVTAAGARPGVNSVTLADADAVARAVLRVTRTKPGSATTEAGETARGGTA